MVIQLTDATLNKATETIVEAFSQDKVFLWIFDGEKKYQQNAYPVVRTWVKWVMLYGFAYMTPGCEAVILCKYPGRHYFSIWTLLRSGMIKTPLMVGPKSLMRIMKTDHFFTRQQMKAMGSNRFFYCWMLGASSHFRHQGYAQSLMDYTFHANKFAVPCYLETSSADNVVYYQKHGFKLLSSAVLPGSGIEMYNMRRD